MSVSEAAARLGVTPDAVRQRIRRDTIEYEKTEDGRYYVYLTPQDTLHDGLQDAYINALKSQIAMLERELEDRKEEAQRYQHLLARALERIPAIESPPDTPSEPRESPVSASGDFGSTQAAPPPGEQRSWWHRLFR